MEFRKGIVESTKWILAGALFAGVAASAGVSQAQTAISPKNAVYPITLTKNGNYKLTGNLVVPDGKSGIVLAEGVDAVIDLGGFAISGPADCSQYTNCYVGNGTVGVQVAPGNTLNISNGRVTGFTRLGVGDPGGFNFSQVIAKNMRIEGNGSGLRAYALSAENVLAYGNSGIGIGAQTGSALNCQAISNYQGISISLGNVRGCVANHNTEQGFLFQRTPHQDNVTFDNGTIQVGEGAYSPGVNNGFND